MMLQQQISLRKNQDLVGTVCRVLIEDFDEEKRLYAGRSMRFAPEVDGRIYLKSPKKLPLNEFADAKITGASEYDLFATAL